MGNRITRHTELQVYQRAFDSAMTVFRFTKRFPKEEMYSLSDQVRRSSRSVCANVAEAWRKRRYPAAFVAKLNDAEAEAAETQTWIQFAVKCEYISSDEATPLYKEYDEILALLVAMIHHPEKWTLK